MMARHFGRRGFLQSEQWAPHVATLHRNKTYMSEWPLSGETLWTIVNRDASDISGPQLSVAAAIQSKRSSLETEAAPMVFWDCMHGRQLQPNAQSELSFTIEGYGLGCVFASSKPQSANFSAFLKTMAGLTVQPLASLSSEWRRLNQTMVVEKRTPPPNASSSPSTGMARIPAVTQWRFRVNGTQIEGVDPTKPAATPGNSAGLGADVQWPFEEAPTPFHDALVDVDEFYIDKTPVTNAQYARYLQASGYEPKDSHNFLRHWNTTGSSGRAVPAGAERQPVRWLSLAEARAFCAFSSKRLPTEIEWQRAAQGDDGREYPWGNDKSKANGTNCPPLASRVLEAPAPSDVTAHPSGASPFGVLDLVGNVWQFTSEFGDEHNRAVILRGGSNYYPLVPSEWYKCGQPIAGQMGTTCRRDWYFPNDRWAWPPLTTHGKLFLMSDSWERAGTVGFRCAADGKQLQ